jgi:translation initiation factor IF-1
LQPSVDETGSFGDCDTTNQAATTGTVEEVLPGALYAVRTTNGKRLLAGINSTTKHRHSRLIVGDRVEIRPAAHDPNRGQIIAKL